MHFFNVLEKNAAAATMIFPKPAAMTFSKTCRNRAAMDISGITTKLQKQLYLIPISSIP
jgi:hypothetical protein